MFETIDSAEIHLEPIFGDSGTRLWSFVKLPLHVPWFYVTVGIVDEDGVEKQDMACLSEAKDLIAIAGADYLKIREANIVLPGYMTGKDSWTMVPLAEVWAGLDPAGFGQRTYVYVTQEGNRYLDTSLCGDEVKLEDKKRVFQNPCLNVNG